MKILVTGFEPFGNDNINPSWEAVKALPDAIDGCTIRKLCLPVVFEKAAHMAIEEADNALADIILCTGLAAGREAITPEQVAINLAYGKIPDNEGNMPAYEPIIPGGPDGLFTTLPIRDIIVRINKTGIPASLSYTAGTYVCNDTMYRLLYHYKDTHVKAGFIHLPLIPEMTKDKKSIPLRDLTKALTEAMKEIISQM